MVLSPEGPSHSYERELKENEQEATSDEEAADFGNAPSAGAVEISGKTSEKHEGRRAKMCDPACEKKRRIGYIARTPATDGEKNLGYGPKP